MRRLPRRAGRSLTKRAPRTWPTSVSASSRGSTRRSRRSSPISGPGSGRRPYHETGTTADRPICDASAVTDATVIDRLLEGQEALLSGVAAGAPTDELITSLADLVE